MEDQGQSSKLMVMAINDKMYEVPIYYDMIKVKVMSRSRSYIKVTGSRSISI